MPLQHIGHESLLKHRPLPEFFRDAAASIPAREDERQPALVSLLELVLAGDVLESFFLTPQGARYAKAPQSEADPLP